MKFFRHLPWMLISVSILTALGSVVPVVAQTYLAPTGSTPSTNTIPVTPPLNASDSIQHKAGSLIIGPANGAAYLCLNSDAASNPGSDSTRCINSWDDVANTIGGPFLHYDPTGLTATGSTPNTYVTQPGFVRVKAACAAGSCVDGSRQFYTFLTQAAPTLTGAYGLYASDEGSTANYAGYFSGRLHIYESLTTIPGTNLGQLCLNALSGAECINGWDDVASGGNFLQLQSTNPPTANTGSFSVAGVGVVGSIVIDSPIAITSRTATCGDGLCSAVNGEDINTCAIDCASIAALPSASVTPNTGGLFCSGDTSTACTTTTTCSSAGKGTCQAYSGRMTLSTPSSQAPSGSQVNVLLIRSTATTPTFVPVQGSTYTTGSVFGDSTIIYAGKLNQSLVNSIVGLDRVTASGTYAYRGYVGNLYPRYGTVYTPTANASVTYKQLTVTKGSDQGVPVSTGPDTQISCASGVNAFCTGRYSTGTTVTLSAANISSGYLFNGWIGCNEPRSATNTTCTVTLSVDTTVQATYIQDNGGGGCEPDCGPPIDIIDG